MPRHRTDITDEQRMEWLERNLISLHSSLATNSVRMDGITVTGQLVNEALNGGAGPHYFRVSHRSIREALDAAMYAHQDPQPG